MSKFDLSKPKVTPSWKHGPVVYEYNPGAGHSWCSYFDEALEKLAPPDLGLPRVEVFGSELFHNKYQLEIYATPAEVGNIAKFLYSCAKYADDKVEADRVAAEIEAAQEEIDMRLYYEQFAKIPGPSE